MTSTPPLFPLNVASAAFFCLECNHSQLFHSEYKRSNRTKGLKILRCFPHCCPDHIDRSYCGTSLSVRVELVTCLSASSTDPPTSEALTVFARFEAVSDVSLQPGECVEVDKIAVGTQSDSNLEGQWVAGMLDRPSGLVTTIRTPGTPPGDQKPLMFHLNTKPFSRWYYDWESGANKAQRLMKHVLKAYVVERCAVDTKDNFISFMSCQAYKQLYRVLYVVTSPEFTVVSYRRASSDQYQAALVSSQSLAGVEISVYDDTRPSQASTTVKVEPSYTETDQLTRAYPSNSPGETPHVPEVDGKENDASLLEHTNFVIMSVTRNLALVFSFICWSPLSACSSIFDEFVQMVHLNVQEAVADTSGEIGNLNHLSQLLFEQVRSEQRAALHGSKTPQQLKILLKVLTRATQWLFSKKTRAWIRTFLRQYAGWILDKRALRACFALFIQELQDRLDKQVFVHTELGSLENVAEEVIAAVYSNSYYHAQRPHVRQILSRQQFIGWSAFVAQMREAYISVSSCTRTSGLLARRWPDFTNTPQNPIERSWNGKWLLDVEDISWKPNEPQHAVRTDVGDDDYRDKLKKNTSDNSLSLLSIFQLISQALRLEIALDIQSSTLHVRSTQGVAGPVDCLRVVLDSKARTFSQFPNGMASAIDPGAYGDYIGEMRVERSDRLVAYLQIFNWAAPGDGLSYNVRMRIECWRSCRLCINGNILATPINGPFTAEEVASFGELPLWGKQEFVNKAYENIMQDKISMQWPWRELGKFRLNYTKI
ncbi:hypothetical protein PsorP6_016196 [Peronosclerospora sorghi]|uniref:Uncharacterized protein n=1 Tax=Peronosclerospora sorghi TaxID=230839 RepID=A0ACC0VNK8_9STRA|nr:hypothetical protein PsorP6_016196 [Peronosclerospora sorghi]